MVLSGRDKGIDNFLESWTVTERVTLITGASAGIGMELARIFAASASTITNQIRCGNALLFGGCALCCPAFLQCRDDIGPALCTEFPFGLLCRLRCLRFGLSLDAAHRFRCASAIAFRAARLIFRLGCFAGADAD